MKRDIQGLALGDYKWGIEWEEKEVESS